MVWYRSSSNFSCQMSTKIIVQNVTLLPCQKCSYVDIQYTGNTWKCFQCRRTFGQDVPVLDKDMIGKKTEAILNSLMKDDIKICNHALEDVISSIVASKCIRKGKYDRAFIVDLLFEKLGTKCPKCFQLDISYRMEEGWTCENCYYSSGPDSDRLDEIFLDMKIMGIIEGLKKEGRIRCKNSLSIWNIVIPKLSKRCRDENKYEKTFISDSVIRYFKVVFTEN